MATKVIFLSQSVLIQELVNTLQINSNTNARCVIPIMVVKFRNTDFNLGNQIRGFAPIVRMIAFRSKGLSTKVGWGLEG